MTALAPDGQPWRQYLCRVCGLVYDEARGDPDSGLAAGTRFEAIPDDWACPICGVGKADFEPVSAAAPPAPRASAAHAGGGHPAATPSTRAPGVVVVGAGRAGWAVAQALRSQGYAGPITLVAACSGDVYDKPQLSVAVARGLAVDTLVREAAAEAAQRLEVKLLCGTHALGIDAQAKRLRTTRGTLRFSHLVLAHGAAPALPAELPPSRVWRVNDLQAYRRLRVVLDGGPQRLAIVGAGLVGCELANDLALAGHTVSLLDLQPQPLAAQLPALVGQRLLAAWVGLPIRFLGGVRVTAVEAGDGPVRLQLSDGQVLEVDQVLAATGLRTPGRLAHSAGLAYDERAGGLVVEAATGRTSAPGIYALGDCAVADGQASRYIEPIARQAAAIATHVLGQAGAAVAEPGPASPAPVLRVKTSAWPITLTRHQAGVGQWLTEVDTPAELRLRLEAGDGTRLASLVARRPVSASASPGTVSRPL